MIVFIIIYLGAEILGVVARDLKCYRSAALQAQGSIKLLTPYKKEVLLNMKHFSKIFGSIYRDYGKVKEIVSEFEQIRSDQIMSPFCSDLFIFLN